MERKVISLENIERLRDIFNSKTYELKYKLNDNATGTSCIEISKKGLDDNKKQVKSWTTINYTYSGYYQSNQYYFYVGDYSDKVRYTYFDSLLNNIKHIVDREFESKLSNVNSDIKKEKERKEAINFIKENLSTLKDLGYLVGKKENIYHQSYYENKDETYNATITAVKIDGKFEFRFEVSTYYVRARGFVPFEAFKEFRDLEQKVRDLRHKHKIYSP